MQNWIHCMKRKMVFKERRIYGAVKNVMDFDLTVLDEKGFCCWPLMEWRVFSVQIQRTESKTLSWWQSPVSFNTFSNLSLFSMDVFFSSAITAPLFDALVLFFTFFNKIFLWISFRKTSSFQSPSFFSFLF